LDSDDGHGSPICSLPGSQNMQSNNIMSFAVPVEAHIDEEKDNSKSALSSTICDNRSAYPSLVRYFFLLCYLSRLVTIPPLQSSNTIF